MWNTLIAINVEHIRENINIEMFDNSDFLPVFDP